jgi:hypothetical protein
MLLGGSEKCGVCLNRSGWHEPHAREWPDPPLVLRHSSKRIFGTWEDDYDVMSGERIVGRIFKSHSAPKDKPSRHPYVE